VAAAAAAAAAAGQYNSQRKDPGTTFSSNASPFQDNRELASNTKSYLLY